MDYKNNNMDYPTSGYDAAGGSGFGSGGDVGKTGQLFSGATIGEVKKCRLFLRKRLIQ